MFMFVCNLGKCAVVFHCMISLGAVLLLSALKLKLLLKFAQALLFSNYSVAFFLHIHSDGLYVPHHTLRIFNLVH